MSHEELSKLCAALQIQSGRPTIPTLVRNIWGALVRIQNVTSGVGQDGQLITVEDGEERSRLPFSGMLSQRIRQEVWTPAVGTCNLFRAPSR